MVFTKNYYVYLLANWNNKVIYTGVTNDLNRRIYEHKNKIIEGFSQKYNLTKLVYFEETQDIKAAITKIIISLFFNLPINTLCPLTI